MAKLKRSSPALYELIQSRPTARAPAPPVETPPQADRTSVPIAEVLASWLGAGRIIRVPVGFILVAIFVVLALLVINYMLAYHHGRSVAEAEYAAGLDSSRLARPGQPEDDPLNRPMTELPSGGNHSRTDPVPPRPSDSTGASAAPDGRSWGPVFSDPRREGLQYFVLATTTRQGAQRLAEFCRSSGLEAYVVPANTSGSRSLHMTIALPGFAPDDRSGTAVKSLESRIHQIGDRWKRTERGATDLRDAYPLPPYQP